MASALQIWSIVSWLIKRVEEVLFAGGTDLTMADAMRAMLDELMGKERNIPLDQRKGTDLRFNDPEVCKYALAGLCPYGLFKNTKSDLGKYEVSG